MLFRSTSKSELSAGKNPMGLAASILYISCVINGCNIGQTIFAQTAGVTEVTIRNISKHLRNHLDLSMRHISPAEPALSARAVR